MTDRFFSCILLGSLLLLPFVSAAPPTFTGVGTDSVPAESVLANGSPPEPAAKALQDRAMSAIYDAEQATNHAMETQEALQEAERYLNSSGHDLPAVSERITNTTGRIEQAQNRLSRSRSLYNNKSYRASIQEALLAKRDAQVAQNWFERDKRIIQQLNQSIGDRLSTVENRIEETRKRLQELSTTKQTGQLKEAQEQLEDTEEALSKLKRQQNSINTTENTSKLVSRASNITSQLKKIDSNLHRSQQTVEKAEKDVSQDILLVIGLLIGITLLSGFLYYRILRKEDTHTAESDDSQADNSDQQRQQKMED